MPPFDPSRDRQLGRDIRRGETVRAAARTCRPQFDAAYSVPPLPTPLASPRRPPPPHPGPSHRATLASGHFLDCWAGSTGATGPSASTFDPYSFSSELALSLNLRVRAASASHHPGRTISPSDCNTNTPTPAHLPDHHRISTSSPMRRREGICARQLSSTPLQIHPGHRRPKYLALGKFHAESPDRIPNFQGQHVAPPNTPSFPSSQAASYSHSDSSVAHRKVAASRHAKPAAPNSSSH